MKELLITRRCQNCSETYSEYEGGGATEREAQRITIQVHQATNDYRVVEMVHACSIECARILTARVKVQEPERREAAKSGVRATG